MGNELESSGFIGDKYYIQRKQQLNEHDITEIKKSIEKLTNSNSCLYKPINPHTFKHNITTWLSYYPSAGYTPFKFSGLEKTTKLAKKNFQKKFPSLSWIWDSNSKLLNVGLNSIIQKECVTTLINDLEIYKSDNYRSLWRDSLKWVTIEANNLLIKEYVLKHGKKPNIYSKEILRKYIRNIARLDNYGVYLAYQRMLIANALQKNENAWLKNIYELSMSESILYNTCYGIHMATKGAIEFSFNGYDAKSLHNLCSAGTINNKINITEVVEIKNLFDENQIGNAYMLDGLEDQTDTHFIARSASQIIIVSIRYLDNSVDKRKRDSYTVSLMSSAFRLSGLNYFTLRRVMNIDNKYSFRIVSRDEADKLAPVSANGHKLFALRQSNCLDNSSN